MHSRVLSTFALLALGMMSCQGPAPQTGAPLRIQVDKRPWKHPGGTGVVLTSAHYRIFASTENQALLGVLPGFLEAAYANYVNITTLTHLPDGEPMAVYMLASRSEWVHLSQMLFGPDAAYTAINAGAYSYKGVSVCWNLSDPATLATAAHEGLHQFLYHRLRNRLPLCIEEGLATSAEGYHIAGLSLASGIQGPLGTSVQFLPGHNPKRFGVLTKVVNSGQWTPSDQILGMNAADYLARGGGYSVGWYGQVWAMMQFIQSNPVYRQGLGRMLADARDGRFHLALQTHPQFKNITAKAIQELQRRPRTYNKVLARPLFEHYIQRDLKLFEREYVAFARKLVAMPSEQ